MIQFTMVQFTMIQLKKINSKILVSLLLLLAAYSAQGIDRAIVVKNFYEVTISPDGQQVAWAQPLFNDAGQRTGSGIFMQTLHSNAAPKRISSNAVEHLEENSVAWSPDSNQIVFLSNSVVSPQEQLYVTDVHSGASRKLTILTGDLSAPAWSPDGKSIAFLFIQDAPRSAGPLMPMTAETGVVDTKVYEQRLAVVDVASGEVKQISPADMYVYEFNWSPDGNRFALTAAHGAGDANWYVAQLYTLDIASPDIASAQMSSIYKPSLQIADPRWSPDGKQIAFISGIMSDEGVTGGDVFVIPASGGMAKDITQKIAASPADLYWLNPGTITFAENIDGNAGLGEVEVESGKVSQLWSGEQNMSTSFWGEPGISFAANGNSAFIGDSSQHPPELWAGTVGHWQPITHGNDSLQPDWGMMKSIHWMNGSQRVQGWLLYPKNYDAREHYPMVVVPHGGPASDVRSAWPSDFFNTNELSAHGYFVFYPNPRGSYGEGEAFAQGNVKDFGYGDFHDIMTGVDEIVRTVPVDNNHIGITGWSYGGYMTMWAVTQTNRFHAAVSGAGLANFQSYYGQNDIDEWMIPYFGSSVYDDPAVYAKSSPITFIKNAKTPTLLLVGERDGECPAPQSREYWHALKTLGVETQLVIYAGEGHAFLKSEHRQDVMERLVGWFDQHLKAQASGGVQ
jgi:dipeptidyl aminopeptidase/acylaminoacyl peptidase